MGNNSGSFANSNAASSPSEWQAYANQLLAVHFATLGHAYIPIPDKAQGDGGLEGFSTNGDAFQAYCDEESVSTADRAKKQKSKITRDLAKLADSQRANFWIEVLQSVKIRRWFLLVPQLEDKSVIAHARKKGADLRRRGIPYLSDDFEAFVVVPGQAYPLAALQLLKNGVAFVPTRYKCADDDDVRRFEAARVEQLQTLHRKLSKLPSARTGGDTRKSAETLVKRYLDSENLLEQVRAINPELWERIQVMRQEYAQNLITERLFDSAIPVERMRDARSRFKVAMESLSTAMSASAADTLSIGAIVLWLLECPLDFPESTNE